MASQGSQELPTTTQRSSVPQPQAPGEVSTGEEFNSPEAASVSFSSQQFSANAQQDVNFGNAPDLVLPERAGQPGDTPEDACTHGAPGADSTKSNPIVPSHFDIFRGTTGSSSGHMMPELGQLLRQGLEQGGNQTFFSFDNTQVVQMVNPVNEPMSQDSIHQLQLAAMIPVSQGTPQNRKTGTPSSAEPPSTPVGDPMLERLKQLEKAFQKQTKEMDSKLLSMEAQVLDLEADKEALKRDNVAQLKQLLSASQDRVRDRKEHLDLVDDLRQQIQDMKASTGKSDPFSPDGNKEHIRHGKKEESYAYFVTKFAQHFPMFDPRKSELQIRGWEDYWDQVKGFQRITQCSDMVLAYLIKDSAALGSELDTCLKDISHSGGDGFLDIQDVGLDGIQARMEEDFGPRRHNMAQQARDRYANTRRKFKERPKWYFRRLEMNELQMYKADPDHKVSDSYKANLVFFNSGLERNEREKVFREAGGKWDYVAFKRIILERYDLKHELDCAMVEKAWKNRSQGQASQTYVVHDPEKFVEGTDLYPGDCDEDDLDAKVDLSEGQFVPHQPAMKATGDFFDDYPEESEAYQEIEYNEVNYVNEYGQPQETDSDEDDWYDDGASSCYTANTDEAYPIEDLALVAWVEQDDGEFTPWQWYLSKEGHWDCYLAYQTEDVYDEEEEASLEQMADIYLATTREIAQGEVSEEQFKQMREVYIADARAKRSFGKGKGKGKGGFKGKGKGKGRSSSKGKGKGKGKGRRRWGPRKGPKRSQSRTRGYADNSTGKQLYNQKVPFKKEHMSFQCRKCNHRTDAGEPVPPHKLGDLICPEVQAGRVMAHPRWVKFKDKYPHVKFYTGPTKGQGKGKKPFQKRFDKPREDNNLKKVFGSKSGDTIAIKDPKNPIKRGNNGRFQINMVEGDPNEEEWVDAVDAQAVLDQAQMVVIPIPDSPEPQKGFDRQEIELQALLDEQQRVAQAQKDLDDRIKELKSKSTGTKPPPPKRPIDVDAPSFQPPPRKVQVAPVRSNFPRCDEDGNLIILLNAENAERELVEVTKRQLRYRLLQECIVPFEQDHWDLRFIDPENDPQGLWRRAPNTVVQTGPFRGFQEVGMKIFRFGQFFDDPQAVISLTRLWQDKQAMHVDRSDGLEAELARMIEEDQRMSASATPIQDAQKAVRSDDGLLLYQDDTPEEVFKLLQNAITDQPEQQLTPDEHQKHVARMMFYRDQDSIMVKWFARRTREAMNKLEMVTANLQRFHPDPPTGPPHRGAESSNRPETQGIPQTFVPPQGNVEPQRPPPDVRKAPPSLVRPGLIQSSQPSKAPTTIRVNARGEQVVVPIRPYAPPTYIDQVTLPPDAGAIHDEDQVLIDARVEEFAKALIELGHATITQEQVQ